MTQEIYAQLARISGQQSKIRAMRDQLAAFAEAITKQDAAFAELLLVARIPSAYRHCLAECMRRQALFGLHGTVQTLLLCTSQWQMPALGYVCRAVVDL